MQRVCGLIKKELNAFGQINMNRLQSVLDLE